MTDEKVAPALSPEGVPMKMVTLPNKKIVTVKELTVGQVLTWLGEMEKKGADSSPQTSSSPHEKVVDAYLYESFTLTDLSHMTDLKPDEAKAFPPSYLKTILETCRELNPDFFGMRSRLSDMGRSVISENESGR